MMKKGAILIEDLYNEHEFWVPYYRLLEAGVEMTVVGPKADTTYKSKIGMAATSNAAAADLNGADFDVVVIPGGYAPDRMRRDAGMIKLVRDAFDAGKLVAFICHAGWLPISAGIVKGKRLTSFFAIKDDLVNAGAEWVDEAVVRDGNMITSRTPADLPDFCRAIVEALAE
jgi:protease I